MSAEAEFKQLMLEAEGAAWKKSNDFTSKLQTSAKFSARKTLRKSPTLVVKFLVGRVPIIGPILSLGAGKISEKIQEKRKAAGVFKNEVEAASAVGAKFMSKSLSELGTNIDGNITKQQAAYRELETALNKLNSLNSADGVTASDWLNAFKNAAYAYYRVDHYNLKLVELVNLAQCRLDKIGEWTEKGTDVLVDGTADLKKCFVARYEDMLDDRSPLLGRARSSSSGSFSEA